MLAALTQLLVFQLIGEIIARSLGLPIPGPVIGMGLMFLFLILRGGPDEGSKTTANTLLQHLSLMFVPAGTGVMLHFQRMADEWLPITAALLGSTFLAMAVTALVLKAMTTKTTAPQAEQGEQP
ncbi:MAG: CidA/LrgA family protein [Rhodocyclaceae bacterium]|nr:MAG: CidA/LrgA family protein [Rhodocyclaceae bacterium]